MFPGAGVPVSDFYLPFFEDYPGSIDSDQSLRAVYRPPGMFDLFTSNKTAFTEGFKLMAGVANGDDSDAAVPAAYADAFVAVVAQFKAHVQNKQWNRTQYQLYLKTSHLSDQTLGVEFDEPVDFLKFFGKYADRLIWSGLPASVPSLTSIAPRLMHRRR